MSFGCRAVFALATVAMLAGCAALSPDGGADRVSELARERNVPVSIAPIEADETDTDARAAALLAQPLTADAAVEIALHRNPGFRARVAQLAGVDAERVQAGRLANPSFSFSNKRSSEVRAGHRHAAAQSEAGDASLRGGSASPGR
jgi:hypothetical protein